MKSTLYKKLPAFLLALAMTAGLMPAAFAAHTHDNWSAWVKVDDEVHQRRCLEAGCSETQTQNHNWSTAYSTDGSAHWLATLRR